MASRPAVRRARSLKEGVFPAASGPLCNVCFKFSASTTEERRMDIGVPETEREIEIAPLEEPVPGPAPVEAPVEEPVPA